MFRNATSHRYVTAGRGVLMMAFVGPTDDVNSFQSRLAMFLPLRLDFSGL